MLGRASAAVTLDRYADLLDDDLTWWRTGWTLWRAWRANFLRTVSGLTGPNVYPWATTFPRDEDR